MTKSPTAFVAYSSRDSELAGLIAEAVERTNALPIGKRFEPWIFNDVPGAPIISEVLEKIETSAFIVADITYLNLNVLYEVGFAIGRNKRVFLVRHRDIPGDRELAKSAGIFDTLGYFEFSTSEELKDRLSAYIDGSPLQSVAALDQKAPVYIVEPPTRGDAVTLMISRLKKTGFKYRSFNPTEDARLSAVDAIQQVYASSGVAVMLQDEKVVGADVNNIRALFVVGLADGLLKPRLLFAPNGHDAPIDVRDTVTWFRHPGDITRAIAEFCPRIVDYLTQSDPHAQAPASPLSALRMGDPTAENEMATLDLYYLKTDQYQRALRGEVNLVVGRKGSGKTALFVSVRDKIRAHKQNIVVDLKPEGYQLLKIKEDILTYLTDGARHHLITAFWEYLILLEVAYKMLEKDRPTYRFNHEIYDLYMELERVYSSTASVSEGDFSERLLVLSQRLATEYKAKHGQEPEHSLTSDDVTELVYSHDIKALRERVSTYLEKKNSVWILFDNLDKGWSTTGVDELDAVVLRCLIDAGRKIEREMSRAGHVFHCVVFVRNDVYDHLMRSSADYGKEMRAVLDWTDADLLKEMLRLRLASELNEADRDAQFSQLWPNVCVQHYLGEDTAQYFVERSLMRPRNLLKIFNHCRGFAVNFNRERIEQDDIEKGLRAYSQDVVSELDRELSDVFPVGENLIYKFVDAPSVLGVVELQVLLSEGGVEECDFEQVIEFLLYYGVLGVRSNGDDYYIYDLNYDPRMLKVRVDRAGAGIEYLVNPAFWPALGIVDGGAAALKQGTLSF